MDGIFNKLFLDLKKKKVGKTFDTFAPIGPCIVTNIANPHNLGIK